MIAKFMMIRMHISTDKVRMHGQSHHKMIIGPVCNIVARGSCNTMQTRSNLNVIIGLLDEHT